MIRSLLVLLLLVGLAQGHTICQSHPDGSQACQDGPDAAPISGGISISFSGTPGLTFSDELSYSGTGSVEQTFQGDFSAEKFILDGLLFDLWGQLDQVHDVAFFLVTHGYNSTYDGLVTLSDESRWQIVFGPGEIIRLEKV
jgi:hypothetical protein